MRKFLIFLFSLFTIHYSLFTIKSSAYVNVIERWDGPTIQKIQENFGNNAWVVAVGSPDNDLFAQTINAYSFNWIIRGHAHWLPIGQEMFENPESAAQKWNQFFQKLNKKIYFQPWNEPTSIDPECQGESLKKCVPRIVRFINALNTSKIRLTTPAFDPHNQENTAAELIKLMKESGLDFSKFKVITMNVYNPDLAKTYHQDLTNWGFPNPDLPIVFTESGLLSYHAYDICQNMYCAGVIEQWQSDPQVIGWAIFSEYHGWNLWSNQCVIDALKGDCHCETCELNGGKKTIQGIVSKIIDRPEKPLNEKPLASRNLFPGASTLVNEKSWPQKLFGFISSSFDLFRLPHSLDWVAGPFYQGEDVNINYSLETQSIKLEEPFAKICIPEKTTYSFKFFPDFHPGQFAQGLLNLTSIHDTTYFRGLNVFYKLIEWYTGSAHDKYFDPYDEKQAKELFRRAYSQRKAGLLIKSVSKKIRADLWNKRALEKLLLAADPTNPDAPQEKDLIPLMDHIVAYLTCKGFKTPFDPGFTKTLPDGRIDPTYYKDCGDSEPIPIKVGTPFCCNRDFFESRGYNFEKNCAHVTNVHNPESTWVCQKLVKGMEGTIFNSWFISRALEELTSREDLPIYYEVCHEIPQQECESKQDEQKKIYHGFFSDLSEKERFEVLPVATENNWPIRNTFITENEGKCWSCQVVKVFIPWLQGAIDACNGICQTSLPYHFYQGINQEYKNQQVVNFPCDPGKLPNADGPITPQSNEVRAGPQPGNFTPFDFMAKAFTTQHQLDSCPIQYDGTEYKEEYIDENGTKQIRTVQVPRPCEVRDEIETRAHIYVPYYGKIRACIDCLYGQLPEEIINALESEIGKRNNKLNPRDLLFVSNKPQEQINSGLDRWLGRIESYKDPSKMYGRSDTGSKKIYGPGAGIEFPAETIFAKFIPYFYQDRQEKL